MGNFNYSKLHIFNKQGIEIPINIESNYKIVIPNEHGTSAVFYPIVNSDGNIVEYYKESSGTRFTGENTVLDCYIADTKISAGVEYSEYSAINDNLTTESPTIEYSIKNIKSISEYPEIAYPSVKLNSFISFEPVSTELVETESLYLFVKDEADGEYKRINEYDIDFTNRYEILFFIDCRSQEDFRFFRVNNDDIIWSDRFFMNLEGDTEESYRVNIGFTAKEEGNYTEILHICLLDRGPNKSIAREDADITVIGTIELSAEAIGEDERYRTLFTNFGIPDPKEYVTLFTNTPVDDDNIDNILLNQNSKKMFLTYPEIFPYVGTYKALTNAVKTLGYDDLYFKEWYKRTGSIYKTGYVAYDMTYNADVNANVINNTSLEERVHLKKLNWLSMVYRINKEILDHTEDKFGFPAVENIYDFSHEDILVKLISLRDWLQKYIIGLNCRIIDVGGEGIYFERYQTGVYGTYETVYDWINHQEMSPEVISNMDNMLVDSSINILVNLNLDNSGKRLEEIADRKFSDFIEGALVDGIFNKNISDIDEYNPGVIYCGKTLYSFSDLERYQIRSSVTCNDFVFNYNNEDNESYLTEKSSALWLHNNELYLDPLDLHNGKDICATFNHPPFVYLRAGKIHTYKTNYTNNNIRLNSDPDDWMNEDNTFIVAENDEKLLYPDSDNSIFLFGEEDDHGRPVFIMTGYNISNLGINKQSDNYILEIQDGQIIFNLSDNTDKSVILNFVTDKDGNQNISVNIIYTSDEIIPRKYINGDDTANQHYYFADHTQYQRFYDIYKLNPDSAIIYNEIIPVNVNHAGKYIIDVIGKDMYNNIFAARTKNDIVVQTPKYNVVSYSTIDNNNIISDADKTKLLNDYINYCIYKKEYNSFFTKENTESTLQIVYSPYSNTIDIPEKDNYIHFSNKLEKFIIDESVDTPIKNLGPSTSESYEKDGKTIYVNEGYELYLKKAYRDSFYRYNNVKPLNNVVSTALFENTEYDVNIVFYNELGGYPVYQSYGRLTPNNDGYILTMADTSDQNYIWAKSQSGNLPEINWITKPDVNDPNNLFYYGVGYRDSSTNSLYYIKTKGMSAGEKIGETIQHEDSTKLNFTFNLVELLSHNEIGIYVEPINLVSITINNSSISKNIDNNNLILSYASGSRINVEPGDMVKVIFSSAYNNNYFMQSAYKVLEVHSDYLVVEGNINDAYVRILGNNIYYNTGVIFDMTEEWTDTSSTVIDNFVNQIKSMPGVQNAEVINYKTSINVYDDIATHFGFEIETIVNDNVKRTTFDVIPNKTNDTAYIYELVSYMGTGGSEYARTRRIGQEQNINAFVTYAHTAYTDYILKSDKPGEILGNKILLSFENNVHNKWLMDYIDSKFVVTTRNFDTNNGIYSWMDLTDPKDAHNNVFGGIPLISEKSIYKYNTAVITKNIDADNSLLIITPENSIPSNSKICWRIWQLSNISNNRILKFESYNPALYLDLAEPGIYDIEMNVYDKFGNASYNVVKNICKVI